MLYQFSTDSLKHAKSALLLYAMYRSRDKSSALNGVDTWNRFAAYIRAASLRSHTTAGFVQEFCRKAKIGSVRPKYLSTGEPVLMRDSGELIDAAGVYDYRLDVMEDDTILPLLSEESMYLIMLVRERLQREKMYVEEETESED